MAAATAPVAVARAEAVASAEWRVRGFAAGAAAAVTVLENVGLA